MCRLEQREEFMCQHSFPADVKVPDELLFKLVVCSIYPILTADRAKKQQLGFRNVNCKTSD